MGHPVYVETVLPAFNVGEQIGYPVTLSCGCFYWEYRPMYDPPPALGDAVRCYAHSTDEPTMLPSLQHEHTDASDSK
jgi:hypothetical protein